MAIFKTPTQNCILAQSILQLSVNAKLYSTSKEKFKIVMVRHGESEWNQKNLFCGWFDAQLSNKGKTEAKNAGEALKKEGYVFDVAYTSLLSRANKTLDIILKEMDQSNVPITKTWRLNERHYGALTGLNKADTAKKYGEQKVNLWRRSYDVPPPIMKPDHPYYKAIVDDARYTNAPPREQFPMTESLELTVKRILPFWRNVIEPKIRSNTRIIIAAHGNSLRGIIKYLDKMSEQAIMQISLPTAIPFYYVLDRCLKPVKNGSLKFLGDPEAVKKALAAVAAQGKSKYM